MFAEPFSKEKQKTLIILFPSQKIQMLLTKFLGYKYLQMDVKDVEKIKHQKLTYDQAESRRRFLVDKEDREQQLSQDDLRQLKALTNVMEKHDENPEDKVVSIARKPSGAAYYKIVLKKPESNRIKAGLVRNPPKQVLPYYQTEIIGSDDILEACNQEKIKAIVEKIQKISYDVDLSEATQKLDSIGTILELVIITTYGNSSNVGATDLGFQYRRICHDTLQMSHSFIQGIVHSLQCLPIALEYAQRQEYQNANNQMSQVSEQADEIIKECQKVLEGCEELKKCSKELATNVQKDRSKRENTLKQNENTITKFQTQKMQSQKRRQQAKKNIRKSSQYIQKKKEEYNTQVNRYKNQLSNLGPVVFDTSRSVYFKASGSAYFVLRALDKHFDHQRQIIRDKLNKLERQDIRNNELKRDLYNKLTQLYKELKELEQKIRQEQKKEDEQVLEATCDIKKAVNQLDMLKKSRDKEKVSMESLKICLKFIQNVQITFQQFITFWEQVKSNSKNRKKVKVQIPSGPTQQTEFLINQTNKIKKQSFEWLALGKMTIGGKKKMKKITVDIDSRFLNLTTEKNVEERIDKLVKSLSSKLKRESQRMRQKEGLQPIE